MKKLITMLLVYSLVLVSVSFAGPPASPPQDSGGTPEGTAVLSTGEAGGTKYLREDGDGTSSWQTPAGAGDLLADGTTPLTANWDVGAFWVRGTQFISDVAIGTPPFVVTSTTEVPNLFVATATYALTGDNATAFFNSGTIEHERGGLEAAVNAYAGILAITGGATYELNTLEELETAVSGGAYMSDINAATSEANFKSIVNLENVDIKTAYEANADTNAVTDAEKTVLGNTSGINTGDSATALSVGTVGASTVGITSDGSADDVIIPAANNTTAGVATADQISKVEANDTDTKIANRIRDEIITWTGEQTFEDIILPANSIEFPITWTVYKPNELDDAQRDFLPFFTNNTGATITITKLYAMADVDDYDFRIEEYDADGSSNEALVKAETCDIGTGPYTNDGQTTITNATIEDGHVLVFDSDDTDIPDYIHFTLWYTVGGS